MTIIDWVISNYNVLLVSGIIIAISVVIAKIASMIVRRRMYGNYSNNLSKITARFTYYLIVIIGLSLAAGNLGISLTSVVVAGGLLGIILGLAAQSSVSNLISGLLLIGDKPFKSGDFITYDNLTVSIIDVGLLSTQAATWDGINVRIPNSQLFNSNVMNYTKSVARLVRTQITLFYEEDLDRIEKAITKAFSAQWYTLVEPPPQAFAVEFTDSGIVMEIRVWTAGTTWGDLYFNMPIIITKTLKELGVKFAYPKRIYVDTDAAIEKDAQAKRPLSRK